MYVCMCTVQSRNTKVVECSIGVHIDYVASMVRGLRYYHKLVLSDSIDSAIYCDLVNHIHDSNSSNITITIVGIDPGLH